MRYFSSGFRSKIHSILLGAMSVAQGHTALNYMAKAILSRMPRLKNRLAEIWDSRESNNGRKKLFLDITTLARYDAKTGIQRVVRSILLELCSKDIDQFKVAPIEFRPEHGQYFEAFSYVNRINGQKPSPEQADAPIKFQAGDIYLALDLNLEFIDLYNPCLQDMHNRGVEVRFVVYDLLCVSMPEMFPDFVPGLFRQWLEILPEYDGAVCISKATADALERWMKESACSVRSENFKIAWFHLGADIEKSYPSLGLPEQAEAVFEKLTARPSFLMVSTIEPRKGYSQALGALEILWRQGGDVNLVIVGKNGWGVDCLVERLRNHPEAGRRLFWLEGISDEYLTKLYGVCSGLIAASFGEGFGLPLIEAARSKLPIIARDIPVFREVAGRHAFFFAGGEPEDLAAALTKWLEMFLRRTHPQPDGLPWLSWAESAQGLLQNILGQPSER